LRQRIAILVPPRREILGHVLIGIAVAQCPGHPDLFAAHLLPQRREHADLIGDPVDPTAARLIDHQIPPLVLDHAVQEHGLMAGKHGRLAPPLPLEQRQGSSEVTHVLSQATKPGSSSARKARNPQ
jgi:hypothetical protein